MSDHADTVRHALQFASTFGGKGSIDRECEQGLAALDALVDERDEARRQRDRIQAVQDAVARRKIEAYDAARAQVKREGLSRAEYVLRAEAAEADRDRYAAALERQVEGVGSIPAHIALKLDFARSDFADAEAEMAAELEYVSRFLTDATEAARAALKDET